MRSFFIKVIGNGGNFTDGEARECKSVPDLAGGYLVISLKSDLGTDLSRLPLRSRYGLTYSSVSKIVGFEIAIFKR